MKELIALMMCFLFLGMTGCSTLTGQKTIDPNYAAYERIMIPQFNAERQPLLDLELDPDGRVTNIQMFPQPRHVKVEQKKASPFFRLAEVALRYLGYVGIVWQTGEAIEGIVDASQGDTTYINSANSIDKNAGSVDLQGDYATSKIETFEATAETSE